MQFKKILLLPLFLTLSCNPFCFAMDKPDPKCTKFLERRLTNAAEVTSLSAITAIANKFLLKNPSLSWRECLVFAIASWLVGEGAETIAKEIYKKHTHQSLRECLGSTDIDGLKIDNQRLLRRILSLGILASVLCIYYLYPR